MSADCCSWCGRRAERFCPAAGGVVCSLCCGRKRRRTVDCPDDCRYLVQARRQAAVQLAALGGDAVVERTWPALVHNLRLALVLARKGRVDGLTDAEAHKALSGAADTFRARARGVIYDFKTPDFRVQLVVDELLRVAGLHERGEQGFQLCRADDIRSALSYLARLAERSVAAGRGPGHFLELCLLGTGRDFLRSGH